MVRSRYVYAVSVVGVLGSLPACQPGADVTVAVVRDSAGVRIVEHREVGEGLPVWSLASEPEAVIGADAERDLNHQFTEIRGAIRLSDGRIVVGDWGSKEARYFDADGTHILTVGGAGEGPGEIRFLYNVDRVRGDTLVIDGWPIGSRYWFDEDGEFVRHQVLGPWFPGLLGRTLPDGSFLLDTFEAGSYGNTLERWAAFGPDEDIRPAGIVELVSSDGERMDTLATFLGEWYRKTGVIGQTFAMHALPFTPVGIAAWSASEVFIGHTERPEINVYALSGALVRSVRWATGTIPVTSADHDDFEEEVITGARRPAQVPALRRWLLEATYPEFKPSFTAMIADEDGFLWVRPSTPADVEDVRWAVYDPKGVATATITMPSRFDVLEVDESHVLASWKDELGIEYVSSYAYAR